MYKKILRFYTSTDSVDVESRKFMSLYRYYVFKKVKSVATTEKINL